MLSQLSVPFEVAVDRHRSRTTEDERREASKIEQVNLRRSELGTTGVRGYDLMILIELKDRRRPLFVGL